ncbi:MAG: hypothetical protein IPG07_17575 [Crocinitomicaceae bacterium]|nr:hypothetical protein [Crocinitomicaceae bacterium]MBK6952752.1 hypothetical protein [Crocinitomicaceae bacterium]
MKKLVSIVSVFVLISSCKKDDTPIIYGYDVYPMEEGHYVIYDVVDIFHDVALIPAHDTNYYQIKEVVGEEELDGENQPYRKLYRYYRASDTLNWIMQDVWTVKRTGQSLETLEENKRRISLAFSISYDQYWNYNALNEDEELTARYDNIYEPFSIGSDSYDSTVRVEIENLITFIEYKRQYDIYAMNVGRIIRVQKDLEILNSDTTDIKKGTELFYTAIDFGIE